MKNHRKVLTLHVAGRTGFVNITEDVAAAVRDSGIQEGLCLVNSMHITSSVFINDEESGLKQDYLRWLEQLAPFNAGNDPAQGGYLHNRTGEDNGDAHHRGSISASPWASRSRLHREPAIDGGQIMGQPSVVVIRRPWPSVYRTVPRTVLPLASLAETEPQEQVFYGEFDGRRDKRILIKVIGE